MSYNKFKSSAFNGPIYANNLDSLNNSLTIGNVNCNTTFLGNTNINNISNNNETVNLNLSTGSDAIVGGKLTVNDEIHNNNTIYCKNLISTNDILYPFKTIGFIYIGSMCYPVIKSCYDATKFCTNINLQNLLFTNTCYLLIYPYYSISFYSHTIVQTINNTSGIDLLYSQIDLSSTHCIKFIVKYNNNII